jgi:predicted choloylglycine hydrolase
MLLVKGVVIMYKPRLKGSHYEMGHHYGSLLYKNGVRLDELVACNDEKLKFGIESLNICEKVYPNIIDEIKGMADGLHLRYEALGTFIITAGAFAFDIGCSNLAIKTDDGVFFGRNHDMFTVLKKTTETVLCRPDDGYYFVGQGDAVIGKEDGINEHGLAVGMNFVYPKTVKPGLNFLIIVRMLLETCKTTDEAISVLKNIPSMTSHNIMLVDASGHMAVVEMCSERTRVRYPDKHYITSTNHFNHPDMLAYEDKPEENWFMTKDRLDCMEEALKDLKKVNLSDIKDILSGRKGNLCHYDKKLKFDTLWSFCAELTTLDIERAEGNPSRAKFKKETRLDWAMKKRK